MRPSPLRARMDDRSFLYEIVANGRNSIDVDKFDYLARDTFNLGLKSSYDFTRSASTHTQYTWPAVATADSRERALFQAYEL